MDTTEILKKCEECQVYNRKKLRGVDFVSTSRYLKKVALDLMDFRDKKKFVLIAIDYHTRRVWGQIINTKTGNNVVEFLNKLCKAGNKPEELITDNGKEFINIHMKEFCTRLDIKHRRVSLEVMEELKGSLERYEKLFLN